MRQRECAKKPKCQEFISGQSFGGPFKGLKFELDSRLALLSDPRHIKVMTPSLELDLTSVRLYSFDLTPCKDPRNPGTIPNRGQTRLPRSIHLFFFFKPLHKKDWVSAMC